jgi:predicted Zn-dependent peptidase
MNQVYKKTLTNGVQIVVVPTQTPTVTALVMAGTGSAYESDSEQGLSHFLEHMAFKGTVRRPDAKYIAEELESLGAISNAFTDLENTSYFAKGNPEHLDTFLDVLSDIYLNGTFPETEVQKEKGVIIEEINMYEDRPDAKVQTELQKTLFGDTPTGRPVIGTKTSVASFMRDDFFAYQRKQYVGEKTVVAIAGKCDPKHAIAVAAKYFAAVPKGKAHIRKKSAFVPHTVPLICNTLKQTDQTHLALGFKAFGALDERVPALSLLATVLGRGMSSRLFISLREELGVAYYAGASTDILHDAGVFTISAGIDKERVEEVLAAIAREINVIRHELVSEKELAKAKELTASLIRLGLESSDDIAVYAALETFRRKLDGKRFRLPEDKVRALQAITAQDIRAVANRVLRPDRLAIAVVGATIDPQRATQIFGGR